MMIWRKKYIHLC